MASSGEAHLVGVFFVGFTAFSAVVVAVVLGVAVSAGGGSPVVVPVVVAGRFGRFGHPRFGVVVAGVIVFGRRGGCGLAADDGGGGQAGEQEGKEAWIHREVSAGVVVGLLAFEEVPWSEWCPPAAPPSPWSWPA